MPFLIIKTNKSLPPVDVLVRFEQAESGTPIRNPFRDPPEKTPKADIRVIPSPRAGIPNKYIYSARKPASWKEVVACYREIFDAIPRHGWTSVAVPLCPSMVTLHDVYRIACSEIRRALDERDMLYREEDASPETQKLKREVESKKAVLLKRRALFPKL